jgi:hypothetical protein
MRYSRDDALKRIRRCLEDGALILTKHFRDKLESEDLSMVEALHILRHGNIFNEPEFAVRHQEWNYRIEGTEPDGRHVALVFTIVEGPAGVLITIFAVEA